MYGIRSDEHFAELLACPLVFGPERDAQLTAVGCLVAACKKALPQGSDELRLVRWFSTSVEYEFLAAFLLDAQITLVRHVYNVGYDVRLVDFAVDDISDLTRCQLTRRIKLQSLNQVLISSEQEPCEEGSYRSEQE